jgi:hypothetical protein
MTEIPASQDPDRSDDEAARDSLAGDFFKHVNPDVADLDEDGPGPDSEQDPDTR